MITVVSPPLLIPPRNNGDHFYFQGRKMNRKILQQCHPYPLQPHRTMSNRSYLHIQRVCRTQPYPHHLGVNKERRHRCYLVNNGFKQKNRSILRGKDKESGLSHTKTTVGKFSTRTTVKTQRSKKSGFLTYTLRCVLRSLEWQYSKELETPGDRLNRREEVESHRNIQINYIFYVPKVNMNHSSHPLSRKRGRSVFVFGLDIQNTFVFDFFIVRATKSLLFGVSQ